MKEKTLDISREKAARENISDIKIVGNTDLFQLLCKASSKEQGWMKSTKAMLVPGIGALVQVSTQQRNPDGSYSVAEALSFVSGCLEIADDKNGGRKLIAQPGVAQRR